MILLFVGIAISLIFGLVAFIDNYTTCIHIGPSFRFYSIVLSLICSCVVFLGCFFIYFYFIHTFFGGFYV